ncbi:MAG: hypothetical protein AAB668_03790 [Patescibacteria group bacterium]
MAVMNRDIVMNGGGSIILAEGYSRGFWRSWKAIVVGVCIGILVLFATFIWLLSRPLPIPHGTLFYAVATSEDVRALPQDIQDALPPDWRAYLGQTSRLPFVFGIYRQGETLFSFVISPRWHAPRTEKIHQVTRGLSLISADTNLPSDSGRSYLSYLFEHWRHGGPTLGVRPLDALGYVNGGSQEWITLHVRDGLLVSSVDAPAAPAEPLRETDISLHVPVGGSVYLAEHFEALPYLPDPDRLTRLPGLARVDFTFDDSGEPTFTRLEFELSLSEAEAGVLLGAYGFTVRRAIVLPDGTTSFERIEPMAASGTSLFGPRTDDAGRLADITDETFTLVRARSSQDEPRYAKACANAPVWMRLSARTVSIIANRFGLHLEPSQARPLQIVSENGRLAACFE